MKQIFITVILTLITLNFYGQNCGLVSRTKDKETGIETKGGVVNSEDYYSLLIQREFNSKDSLNYILFLNAASRVMLTDSILKSKGTFELTLLSGKKITLEDAKCENDPLGFGSSIGFTVKTREEILEPIIDDPIQKIEVFGILTTNFSAKNQKKIIKILTCLTTEE